MSEHFLKPLPYSGINITYDLYYGANYFSPDDKELDPPHIHDDYEIYVNLSGDVSFLVNNHLYSIKRGDVLVTRPGDVHVCIFNSTSIHEHFCLWIRSSDDSFLKRIMTSSDNQQSRHHFSFDENDSERVIEIFRGMNVIGKSSDLSIIANMFSLFDLLENGNTVKNESSEFFLPREMKRVLDFINRHFMDIVYVSDIVEKTYVSASTLNRWFKKYLHTSPHNYLEAKKLTYAKQLLDRDMSVTEACLSAGFKDCSRFILLFKKKYGLTPLKYKNQQL